MTNIIGGLALVIGHLFILLAGGALIVIGGVMSLRADAPRHPIIWTIWLTGFVIAIVGFYSIIVDLEGLIP